MSKTKKILSVVLALALVFTLAIPAFALGFEEDDTEYSQIWTLGDAVEVADDTYTIAVSLTTNYPTGAVQFDLVLEGVDLVDAELGDDYPAAYCAEISCNDDKDSAGYGRVMINPITYEYDSCDAEEIDGVIAVITVTGTSGSVTIDKAQKKTAEGGTLIAARLEPADVVVGNQIVGQLINPDEDGAEQDINVVNIGAADPVLVVLPQEDHAVQGVIDETRTAYNSIDSYMSMADADAAEVTGYIYGVEVADYESIDTVFAVENGFMHIVPNAVDCECGTGTLVEVCRDEEYTDVVATYVLVVFGDINGDGAVDLNDSNIMDLNAGFSIDTYGDGDESGEIENELLVFAGDVNCDSMADLNDANVCDLNAGWGYEYTEDPLYRDDGQFSQQETIDLLLA